MADQVAILDQQNLGRDGTEQSREGAVGFPVALSREAISISPGCCGGAMPCESYLEADGSFHC